MTYTPTGHPALDDLLHQVEQAAEGDSNDAELAALNEALEEALTLVPPNVSEARRAYDEARRAYHAAAGKLGPAALTLLKEHVSQQWPTAQAFGIYGEVNEDGELRLHVDEVYLPDGGAEYVVYGDKRTGNRLSEEDGNDDVVEFDEAQMELLSYLADVTGEDYLGRHYEAL